MLWFQYRIADSALQGFRRLPVINNKALTLISALTLAGVGLEPVKVIYLIKIYIFITLLTCFIYIYSTLVYNILQIILNPIQNIFLTTLYS